MHVQDLIDHIQRVAPPQHAAAWDHSGVQVAARTETVTRVAVTLDATPEAVGRAVDLGCQMLLAHHPLALTPQLPSRVDAYWEVLHAALGAGLWVYAAHTTLDTNPGGPAGWLARALDLRQVRVLEQLPGAEDGVGFGQVGDLPEPLPWPELRRRLERFGVPCARRVGQGPARVLRVAICPGSGASLGRAAFALGAQVYVTGDVKYHDAQQLAPLGLTIDAGHFCLEEAMMRIWSEDLASQLHPHGVRVHFVPGHDPFAAD